MNSPLKNSLMRVSPRSSDDYYLTEYSGCDPISKTACTMIQYKTSGQYSVPMPTSDARMLISGQSTELGAVFNVKWVSFGSAKTRSEVLTNVLDDYNPVPLDLRYGHKADVRALYSRSDPPPAEKRKQKELKHNYAAFIGGWCSCRDTHGCPSTFVCGFTEETLRSVVSSSALSEVTLGLTVTGNCTHIKNKAYGQCRGHVRKELVQSLVKDKTVDTTMPKTIMENALANASSTVKHCMNHGGLPVKANTAYNIKKEARTNLDKEYGITSHSDINNYTKAAANIKKEDIAWRVAANDKTFDYAGILRNMNISGGDDDDTLKASTGCKVELWNKTAVLLHHWLAKSGREVLHYDGTGF